MRNTEKKSESTQRACVACDAVYLGELSCPECGEPGEPLCGSCGGSELRYEATTDEVDCTDCGEVQS